jgi:hypothetical protein
LLLALIDDSDCLSGLACLVKDIINGFYLMPLVPYFWLVF